MAPIVLPPVPNREHCRAKRFHLEPLNFCCSEEKCPLLVIQCRTPFSVYSQVEVKRQSSLGKIVRTYNNNFAFTSLGAKYDEDLTKNSRGMYTFCVQGQVYHFLNGLSSDSDKKSRIQFYFHDPDEEISRKLNASNKLRENTLKLPSYVLQDNPYGKFFRDLCVVPNLQDHKIYLNCTPELDQHSYNLPYSSQVAAIFTESDDITIDKQSHIQVYSYLDASYRIKHYYSCYDPLQYPILFVRDEPSWHKAIKKTFALGKKRKCRVLIMSLRLI